MPTRLQSTVGNTPLATLAGKCPEKVIASAAWADPPAHLHPLLFGLHPPYKAEHSKIQEVPRAARYGDASSHEPTSQVSVWDGILALAQSFQPALWICQVQSLPQQLNSQTTVFSALHATCFPVLSESLLAAVLDKTSKKRRKEHCHKPTPQSFLQACRSLSRAIVEWQTSSQARVVGRDPTYVEE